MPNKQRITIILLALVCAATVQAQVPAHLAAHYTLDEGVGTTLHDSSGNGHDGKIVGAQWVAGDPPSLRFSGRGDYVDFGDGGGLKIPGDSTVLAWVRLDASPFPDDATNWTILDCEDYHKEGYLLSYEGHELGSAAFWFYVHSRVARIFLKKATELMLQIKYPGAEYHFNH